MSFQDKVVIVTGAGVGIGRAAAVLFARSGAKVVMKNNAAECVLISPEEYIRLLDELADAQLLAEANQRVACMGNSKLLSQSDVEQAFGITPDDYAQAPEVELE